MTTLQRTLNFLDRKAIEYAHTKPPHAHTAREIAKVGHITPHTLAKTVVFHSSLGYGMAVLPADEFVNFEGLRGLLGVATVRLVSEEELAELFPEGELGAMPPLGHLFGLPVFVDRSLLGPINIAFNAGTHRDLIHIGVNDFLRLTNPVVCDFAMRLESVASL